MAFLTLFRIATGNIFIIRWTFSDSPCDWLSISLKHTLGLMVQKLQTWLIDFELGDNWNGIMKDTLREECDSSEECLRFEQKTCATD